jgi:3-oxoacyl-[acyl-carrier protein] reductase
MNQELKGRVALVTGASRGIGRAIALTLAREGADVILCARKGNELEMVKKEVAQLGVKAYAHSLDARNEKEVDAFFTKTITPIGRLDILVNNVGGVHEHAKFEELTTANWREAWELNFLTAVFFSRAALPWLRKSSAARIINISSTAGKQPGGFNPHFGAAKTALIALSKALANTYASENILVNAVCPTTVSGGIWEEHIGDKAHRLGVSFDEAKRLMEEEVLKKTPVGKIVTPEDIAELVAFFASDRARFITGTCIAVDGGMIKSIF